MVTSPGGTTAAGLSVLNTLEFNKIINSAIQSAYERGIEISKGEK
jgi:pyrroline-5-carboxylate reductase